MLHPKQNRIDYGAQLIPPEGYNLETALGTTYSLDLETLMILPVALFYAQPLDGDPNVLRYDMLDAITKAADKITIYCQKAQIKVPQKFHHLLAYWEKAIHEVQMPHYAQSFHPKVWVIRYVHETMPPVYRLLVTSRNLTFARDWDVAFSTDGTIGSEESKQNIPLVNFLRHLQQAGGNRISETFYNDLLLVKFDKDSGKFNQLKFHPIGITDSLNKKYTNPVLKSKWWEELLIISPFVDDTTLQNLSSITGKKRYLLSRKEELDSVNVEVLSKFTCFQFSKLIEQSELNEELNEAESDTALQNLHAKLFVTQFEDKVHWFIGSANCTSPAQERNIEFLIELRGPASTGIRVKDILNQLANSDKADGVVLFEPYDIKNRVDVTERKRIELQIRKIKYDLSILPLSGEAVPIEGGTAYDLKIQIDARTLILPERFTVTIKPISEEQKKPIVLETGKLNNIDHFTGYAETRLSPFVEFEIWYEATRYTSFLLIMEIQLPSGRLNKIFSSIIDSKDKFLKYLSFLLTGEETSVIDNSADVSLNRSSIQNDSLFDQLPIYEKLLIAASRHPEKLSSVDKLIQRLKDECGENNNLIVSTEFEDFWDVFRLYHKSLSHAE